MEIRKKSFIDTLRGKSVLFNAFMFILIGDKDIIFRTAEQKMREKTKVKPQSKILVHLKKGANRSSQQSKSKIEVHRYY